MAYLKRKNFDSAIAETAIPKFRDSRNAESQNVSYIEPARGAASKLSTAIATLSPKAVC